MSFLFPIYITAAVFGVGVTLIDLIGGIGDDSGDSDTEADVDFDSEIDTDGDGADDGDAEMEDGYGSVVAHDNKQKGNIILSFMFHLRNIIYFSMGFGPVGVFAVISGTEHLTSLYWSVPAGIASLAIARILKRLFRTELDSAVHDEDLLMARAKVIVPILPGEMGKVRILAGSAYTDRYARAKNKNEKIAKNTDVRVTDFTDECLVVEQE
ncbi:MAG: hypothetical protein ACLFR1_13980 [Spirochaetia bacterium]